MLQVREDEPLYTLLRAASADYKNIYGEEIDLIKKSGLPRGQSLRINGDESVGGNPNRYQQHGFHFTADNCIGCHACEAACSEKNNLPPHLSFRAVGYLEGGTYPAFTRMNISMACNHCDDPVCLKGCPTRAYTKHPEYGAVLQDPDICFGCGYCTWVCPYNAPQLDPVAGHVQKCNMCVDRLEAGLKPACVSACVGNALDFGVIEKIPDNREQIKTTLPGFPDPSITRPNIRFQQKKTMPREFIRSDSAPIKYHKNENSGLYRPAVDRKNGKTRAWNLARLSSRENPLVIFTLTTQAVTGAFLITFFGALAGSTGLSAIAGSAFLTPLLFTLIGLETLVLFLSTQHLGKPRRFYRGFNNLRHSPLSREALGVSIFLIGLIVVTVLSLFNHGFLDWITPGEISGFIYAAAPWFDASMRKGTASVFIVLTAASGLTGLYYMHAIYRIKARPFWNHWQVLTSFFGTMFSLGAVLTGLVCVPLMLGYGENVNGLMTGLAGFIVFGLALEGIGHVFHARDLRRNEGEGAASYYMLNTRYGKTYMARNVSLGACLAVTLLLAAMQTTAGPAVLWLWAMLAGLILLTALVSRALFYVIVVPTTMPGAFFWKNRGFEQHARATGLAGLPQVGILQNGH